jgi:hypothetical protein
VRCLRNEFKHYIRQVWLYKNKDDNDILGMRLGGSAGLSKRILNDIFRVPTSELIQRYNQDYNFSARGESPVDYGYHK